MNNPRRKPLTLAHLGMGSPTPRPAVEPPPDPVVSGPAVSVTPPQSGGLGDFPLVEKMPKGTGIGAKASKRWMLNLATSNAMRANRPLWDAVGWLQQQANTERFSPEERARYLGPRMDMLDRSYAQAESGLDRTLAERGLESSSGAVSAYADLAGRRAQGRAGMRVGLADKEEARQAKAQALLRDFLAALQDKNTKQAASVANDIQDYRLQKQELEAQEGGLFEDVMGGIGSLASIYFRGGGRPFR